MQLISFCYYNIYVMRKFSTIILPFYVTIENLIIQKSKLSCDLTRLNQIMQIQFTSNAAGASVYLCTRFNSIDLSNMTQY